MTDHLTRVSIKDYQALADVDFTPGPLTVIVGDNDAGKTAIMRAIRAACFNETGSANIRRGQEEVAVLLEFADDIAVRWRKQRGGGADYRLWVGDDKQDFSKLGAAVPPEVRAALRVAEIEVTKDFRIQPQFHPQEEYYFLLDRPEGQAARALAKMTKLDIVVEAQQAIRVDARRAKADLKATEDNITRFTSDLSVYDGLDDDIDACGRAETLLVNIVALRETLDDMRAAWDAIVDIRAEKAGARDIPSAERIAALKTQYNEVRDLRLAWREYGDAVDALAAVREPPLFVLPALRDEAETLSEMETAFRSYILAHAKVIDATAELDGHDDATSADRKRWRELKTCPECGQPLNHD